MISYFFQVLSKVVHQQKKEIERLAKICEKEIPQTPEELDNGESERQKSNQDDVKFLRVPGSQSGVSVYQHTLVG